MSDLSAISVCEGVSEHWQGLGNEKDIYAKRFTQIELEARNVAWQVLCPKFFQKYISTDSVIVDIGAGDGFFSRYIVGRRKIAVDISEHVRQLSTYGIEVLQMPATDFADHLDEQADIVFMSNFLEHLPTKRHVIEVFQACHQALKPGGKILMLQPNLRYIGVRYWDFIDHHIGLTEHSLAEGLIATGFKVEKMIPRFFPFTSKSTLGHIAGSRYCAFLVSLYLKLPFFWRFFGTQTFIAARAV